MGKPSGLARSCDTRAEKAATFAEVRKSSLLDRAGILNSLPTIGHVGCLFGGLQYRAEFMK
jgi:hypothetical protein